jgi:excisionase family DNA binding protein
MQSISLPPSIEEIAKKAEVGAAELARGAVTLAYDLLRELVDEVKRSVSACPQVVQENGKFLSVEEAAEFLRVKTSTIYSWVSQGKIPHSKVGSRVLFEKSVLVEFVNKEDGFEVIKHRAHKANGKMGNLYPR